MENPTIVPEMRIIPLIFMLLLSFSATFIIAADFEKGLAAYQLGDFKTALEEWTPLAEQGDSYAQYNLGAMHANGDGVPVDSVRAHMWFSLSDVVKLFSTTQLRVFLLF